MSDLLLYKELRLAAHPSLFIFMCMGALVLIPAYPYSVVFFFGCLGLFQSFMFDRETRDIFYTVLLPRPKRDVVKGKLLLAVFAQTGQLILSLPFAFLRTLYLHDGNPVGIEANAAYYGFGLMIYGVFNLVFFSQFYKPPTKRASRSSSRWFLPPWASLLWRRRSIFPAWAGWTAWMERLC